MSDFNRNVTARGGFADRTAAVDAGLRAYMLRVYNYMAAAVALTGVVAWFTFQAAGGDAIRIQGGRILNATPFGQMIFSFPAVIVLFLVMLCNLGAWAFACSLAYSRLWASQGRPEVERT